jgi:hypothetical protein
MAGAMQTQSEPMQDWDVAVAHTTFAGVLGAVASEADIAREKFERLQGAMEQMVMSCPPERRAQAMADVQLVDALAQHLEALSTFAGELSRRTSEGKGLQIRAALDFVTLAEVRGRLTRLCDDPDHPQDQADVDPGDFDLF